MSTFQGNEHRKNIRALAFLKLHTEKQIDTKKRERSSLCLALLKETHSHFHLFKLKLTGKTQGKINIPC